MGLSGGPSKLDLSALRYVTSTAAALPEKHERIPENLDSIAAMAAFVERKRAGARLSG